MASLEDVLSDEDLSVEEIDVKAEGEWEEGEEDPEYDEWEEGEEEEIFEDEEDLLPYGLQGVSVSPIAPKTSRASPSSSNYSSLTLGFGMGALNARQTKEGPVLIIPGLYLGSEAHARCEDDLKELGITHILAIHDKAKAYFPKSFSYLLVPIDDEPGVQISSHFKDAHNFIRDGRELNGGSVFVHCWAGMSRSATVVISYLMKLDQIPFFEAYRRTFEAKPDISPNKGFERQLKAFEKTIDIAVSSTSDWKSKTRNPRQSDRSKSNNDKRGGKKSNEGNKAQKNSKVSKKWSKAGV